MELKNIRFDLSKDLDDFKIVYADNNKRVGKNNDHKKKINKVI